jgi:hypothetical protein
MLNICLSLIITTIHFLLYPKKFLGFITFSILLIILHSSLNLYQLKIYPFTSNLILKNTVEKRAFTLSVSSWLNNAVQVFLLIGFYFMMKHMSFVITMIIITIFIVILLIIVWKINEKMKTIGKIDN